MGHAWRCTTVPSRERVLLSWSGGKDSALALYHLRRLGQYDVVGLLTTVAAEYRRVSHHGVREELLDQQAAALGLPLDKLHIPTNAALPCTHELFVQMMGEKLTAYHNAGVSLVAHGDIFLEDLRRYRETNLARLGMRGLFPHWHRDTAELLHEFIRLGFRAVLTCVDGQKLEAAFAGRELDLALARDLPPGVDPYGEYGEYHSFVYDGPLFNHPIGIRRGDVVQREHRHYADLLPQDASQLAVISAIAGATGTLSFQTPASGTPLAPSNYVFGANGLGIVAINSGSTLSANDSFDPAAGLGVAIPSAPGANLLELGFLASSNASGLFGIYADEGVATAQWTDSNFTTQLFSNVPDGTGTVLIGEVLVTAPGVQPVPEPSSLTLLWMGGTVLGSCNCWRKRKNIAI